MNYTIFVLLLLILTGCDTQSDAPVIAGGTGKNNSGDTTSIPIFPELFVTEDYIDLSLIARISKFRSGIGHDYRDDAESCRSMKHYYQPKTGVDWSDVKIFSPATGTIVRIFDEWAGTQLQIRPFSHPAYTIIIFHVALLKPLVPGDTVYAGAQMGHHIGSQTMSDIAVGFSGGNHWTMISFADIMTDSLFERYKARGVTARSDLIITKEQRDADLLNCSSHTFGTAGTLDNWFVLQ